MTMHKTPRDGYSVNLVSADLASADRATMERAIRDRVQTLYLGDGVMLARVLGRHKMFLHTSDRGFACHVAMDGFWESWITQFFARTLKPGMVAVDVGANYGYYTLLFGEAVTASGHVLAIEPNPRAAHLMRESVLLNGMAGRTRVHEVAVGAPGVTESRLFVPSGEPKNAQLVEHAAYPGGDVVTVAVTTLDALTADFERVDLVKIDAEGAEVGILAGMQAMIRRHRPDLALEFNAARYANARDFLDGLVALYGQVCVVGFDGRAVPVRPETVLTTQVGEDWILYFRHDGA
jgi:FkbM family methyltransferase